MRPTRPAPSDLRTPPRPRWSAATAMVAAVAGLVGLLGCRDGATGEATPRAGDRSPTAAAERSTGTVAPSVEELLASDRPLNIAHAGGDQAHPHSTPFAFAESVLEGADVLEVDVQLSADGVLVVHHDETVDRTTGSTGTVVGRTVAELQELDAGHWWSRCWPCRDRPAGEHPYRGVRTGERPPPAGYGPEDFGIPTLREVAERFPRLPLDIEVKGGVHVDPRRVAGAVARELRALDRVASSIVVSFDSAVVAELHDLLPEVATSPGAGELAAWLIDGEPLADHHRVIQIPPTSAGTTVLSAEVVGRAHAEGVDVWVWAASAEEEQARVYREWLALGVDGVIAGRPAEMTAARWQLEHG